MVDITTLVSNFFSTLPLYSLPSDLYFHFRFYQILKMPPWPAERDAHPSPYLEQCHFKVGYGVDMSVSQYVLQSDFMLVKEDFYTRILDFCWGHLF